MLKRKFPDVQAPMILKLLPRDSCAVRAASILPSLSRAIEELVLNSLDAGSSNIEIKVDMTTFSFEVRDDGAGICPTDLRDKTGEWNVTSKYESGISHGFKGEALAATRVLSSMTVTSKISECSLTYVKSFNHHDHYELDKCTFELSRSHIVDSGTRVAVWQLFKRLPARKMSMRPNSELIKIKEIVQRLSIIYHDVGWILVDDSIGRVIMNLKPQESVSARFSAFHGQHMQSRMKDISVSYGSFRLCGLLSPPLADCCYWTREYQYFYVNNRWMKGTSSVANMIDKVFIAALTSQRSGGPASKHHNPRGSQASHHPCFVLQLSCPPENFDVLSEPNKCKAVFSDPSRVKICVKKLLLKMFEIYRPDLFASAESLCSDYSNSPSTLYRYKGIDTHIQETENDDDHETNDGGIKMITSDVSTKLYNVRTNDASDSGTCTSQYSRRQTMTPDGIVFKSAFLETPPDKNFTKGNFHVQPVSLFSEFEYNGCTMESAIQAQDLSEYVDNQADSTDSDEANMDNHEKCTPVNDIDGRLKHPEITGIGVTVSRLPGFLEYIDDQLDNFGSQSTTGSADKLFQHEEVNDIYANKDYLSQIEFPSDYEDLHDKRGGIDYDSPDSQRYSDNNQRSVQRDNLFCEFPDDDRINSDQSKNQDFYDVSSLNYENSPFDINPVQSVPTVNPAYIRDIGSSIETFEPPTPEVLNVHSDCRINLHNHVFDDLFFSAYLDRSALMPEPVRADIIVKKKKRVGVPLGTRRSAVGEWEMKSTDCISSILDRDFDVSPGNANNTWEAILAPATVTTAITLQKGMLSNLRTIGQVDSKYLLVVSGQLILIVDQHAADERVKLEQMLYGNIHGDTKKTTPSGATNGINNATITSISGTQAVKETMSLTESDLYTLTTKEEIFTDWKFIFSHSNSLQGTDTTEDQMITVTLTQVPIIYGEALTAQDFLEFLHSLTEQSKFMAPRSMLQPPCVKRIAASKACRTAIVFGDVLNRTECQNIMSNLSKTALPFQCAHGRPSAVPLLLLKQVEDSRKDEGGSVAGTSPKLQRTPTYSNIINKNRQKNS